VAAAANGVRLGDTKGLVSSPCIASDRCSQLGRFPGKTIASVAEQISRLCHHDPGLQSNIFSRMDAAILLLINPGVCLPP
jgi:hypothetical protein